MQAPSLLVVPTSPAASRPPPEQRSSSESATIVTIYSMYDDDDVQGGWSASASEETNVLDTTTRHSILKSSTGDKSLFRAAINNRRSIEDALAPHRSMTEPKLVLNYNIPSVSRQSSSAASATLDGSRYSSNSHQSTTESSLSLEDSSLPYMMGNRSSAASTNPDYRRSHVESRHSRANSHGSSNDNHHPRSENSNSHTVSAVRLSDTPSPVVNPRPPRNRPPSRSRTSSSHSRRSENTPTPTASPPVPVAPPAPRPHSSVSASHSSLRPTSAVERTPASESTDSSKHVLSRADDEDADAFHVRNTYARLDMFGVKGDGYDEGLERTRARLGPSRASELRADANLDDGTEKTRDLTPREVEILASLDRYGFYSAPSHDRLIRLPSAPLQRRLSRVSAGPPSVTSQPQSLPSLPIVHRPPKELERVDKWGRMLQPLKRDQGGNVETWSVAPSKAHKLRSRCYKGIPDRWRGAAWEVLMSNFSQASSDGGKRELERLAHDYEEAMDKPSQYDVQIDLDVPRTISGHVMFKTRYGAGQRSLFHVLHSFSLRCPQCGYVQGMGPIAATMLCYFSPPSVYASLVRLHDAYGMHSIFSPGFPGLLEAIYVQERLTHEFMPNVYEAFKKHMVSTTSYATKWYITLFANSVPFQTQLRLWDAFLLEGQDVFVAVAVAIVWVYRDQITSSSANFETVLSLLSSFFVPEDEDALLAWVGKLLGDKKVRDDMKRWRTEWQGLVAKGEDGKALL